MEDRKIGNYLEEEVKKLEIELRDSLKKCDMKDICIEIFIDISNRLSELNAYAIRMSVLYNDLLSRVKKLEKSKEEQVHEVNIPISIFEEEENKKEEGE